MRRSLVVIFALLLALVGVARAAESQLQANRAAAQRDARKLLALVQLPKDVERSAARPRAGGTLVGERSANSRYWARAQEFWMTDADPQSIIAYVKAHRPLGSKIEVWGSSSGPGSNTSLDVIFSWPSVGQEIDGRMLTLTVVTPSSGPSAIVAQSQSSGMFPRPSSERVPSGVRRVAITLRIGSGRSGLRHMHISTYVVWRESRVAALVKAFDNLPIVQPPGGLSCPLLVAGSDGPALTLQFRAGPAGPALARAEVYVTHGTDGFAGFNSCDPIDFWIGGRQQTALTSPTFVRQIGQLIGANIS
jgi:hypothetical protein